MFKSNNRKILTILSLTLSIVAGGYTGSATAEDPLYQVDGDKVDMNTWIGSKIYDRAMGRGCATCHDVSPNPVLTESIQKLSRDEFADVIKNGKNDGKMPVMIGAIMAVGPVKKAKMSEDQAIDAIYAYLKGLAAGDIPAGKVKKMK